VAGVKNTAAAEMVDGDEEGGTGGDIDHGVPELQFFFGRTGRTERI